MIRHEFEQGGTLQHLLLLFTQALTSQMAQTAVCNRHHSLDEQLCRWPLLSLDRLRSDELTMTQELNANVLGVRRQGVVEAAGKLQSAGVIDYRRGRGARGFGPRAMCLRLGLPRLKAQNVLYGFEWSRRLFLLLFAQLPADSGKGFSQISVDTLRVAERRIKDRLHLASTRVLWETH